MPYLLNIDIPNRTSTLHMILCERVPKHYGTVYKPVEKIGRDGGWFKLDSELDCRKTAEQLFPIGLVKLCSYCHN